MTINFNSVFSDFMNNIAFEFLENKKCVSCIYFKKPDFLATRLNQLPENVGLCHGVPPLPFVVPNDKDFVVQMARPMVNENDFCSFHLSESDLEEDDENDDENEQK